MSDTDFSGQRLLVVGGSRGVGRAIALAGAARGADVAILYRSRVEEAEAVLTAIRAEGRAAHAVQADLADA
ncbi:MAG: SDR family NAD(P)-dependent oxidoreductase, partial [Alphaproteobacteria bacterium]|nr:SDR family NAD(P)-dependent oxidoreductase [Alphaproteobacteria bacterium]